MFTDPTTYGAAALAEAVRAAYRTGQTDYSLEPLVAVDAEGSRSGVSRMATRSSSAAAAASAKSS